MNDKISDEGTKIACQMTEAALDDGVVEGGNSSVKGTDKLVPMAQVAFTAYVAHVYPADLEPGLESSAFYDPANFTFPAGTHIAEVEIDAATGVTTPENGQAHV